MTRTTAQGLFVIEGGDPAQAVQQGIPTADSVDAAIGRVEAGVQITADAAAADAAAARQLAEQVRDTADLVAITAIRDQVADLAAAAQASALAAAAASGSTDNLDDGTI